MTSVDQVAIDDYAAQAHEFLDHARRYLAQGHLHQASEKGWGAAAHMAKAVAQAHGWTYEKHSDYHVVMNRVLDVTDDDRVLHLSSVADQLHSNYYRRKRHLSADAIGRSLKAVAELVDLLAPLAQGPSAATGTTEVPSGRS